MSLINEYVVKEQLLKNISDIFDKEVKSECEDYKCESYVIGKREFMKKVESLIDKLILNQKV